MTLILTIANSRGVHQCSDYQLTDAASYKPVSDRAGSKQLEAAFKSLRLNLAFTGIASGPFGRTIDGLSAKLKGLAPASSLQDICEALAKHCAQAMRPHGSRGVLTLVLAVAVVGEPFRVAVLSNVRDWKESNPTAKKDFDIQVRTVKKPFHLITGFRGCVSQSQRQRLKALARDLGRTPAEIGDALAEINSIAARSSRGWVSEGCWVSSEIADGEARRSTIRNVGDQGDDVAHLVGGVDLVKLIKRDFQAAPGRQLHLTHLGGVIGPGTPLPPPQGDPKRFTLSGSSVSAPIRSPSGQHYSSIQITQLDCAVAARLNETAVVPFARVRIEPVDGSFEDFPQPKLPWPQLSVPFTIDGISVDRGWEYTIGHWIAAGARHVQIPRCSRGIRRVAFLKDDDELVVALVSGAEFEWLKSEAHLSATLEASVAWRIRPDGTA